MRVQKSFWQGKKVLITGHTGFKGGWLALWLESMGAQIMGYSLAPMKTHYLFEIASIAKVLAKNCFADIRDFDRLRSEIFNFEPEIVFHLAAQPLVNYSYENPLESFSVNVMGTANLLEAIRSVQSVKAVINVTTDKCYENKEWVWGYRENESLGGYDPYSSSKACSELVTAAFRNSFFSKSSGNDKYVGIASARAGNVIGGGDWAFGRLVPDVLRALGNQETLVIRSPNAIRPWQHVLEPLSGYLILAEKLFAEGEIHAQAWNFGPSEESAKSVLYILEEIKKINNELVWKIDNSIQLHEANYLKLDSSKARFQLGWTPVWDLETALLKTIEWHEAWRSNKNMLEMTLLQIQEHQKNMNFSKI